MIKSLYRALRFQYRRVAIARVFTDIYNKGAWRGSESLSGSGSGTVATQNVRTLLPQLLLGINAHSLLDAPCGDFSWMKGIELPIEQYLGIDIVGDLIAENSRKYGSKNRLFLKLDLVRDRLPKADVVLCRHLLIHLSTKDCFSVLRNFQRSSATYLLITSQENVLENREILFTGSFRPLNLSLPPFSFSEPEDKIPDDHDGTYLSLYQLDKLKL
ncbi:MAG TPA: class I SAM-dependent methyltransferase [Candidatus Angelobacter sp.]|jgi:hypothetical protein|nr:class I SAM-dependent methyltransferase [Candidatus Angelobacter sp.]